MSHQGFKNILGYLTRDSRISWDISPGIQEHSGYLTRGSRISWDISPGIKEYPGVSHQGYRNILGCLTWDSRISWDISPGIQEYPGIYHQGFKNILGYLTRDSRISWDISSVFRFYWVHERRPKSPKGFLQFIYLKNFHIINVFVSSVSNNLWNYGRRHLNYSPTVMFLGTPCRM